MFGIGMPEMILICALALVVVGPDKLPELARSIAKGVLELKKAATGLKESISDEIAPTIDAVKPELEEASKALKENIEQQNRLTYTDSKQNDSDESAEDTTQEQAESNADATAEPEITPTSDPAMSTDELIARAQKSKMNSPEEESNA